MPKYLMPVGNTDFKEIRETGLYYIDKTMLIDQLVGKSGAKVTLFTRPRRFGKSLNMSNHCLRDWQYQKKKNCVTVG